MWMSALDAAVMRARSLASRIADRSVVAQRWTLAVTRVFLGRGRSLRRVCGLGGATEALNRHDQITSLGVLVDARQIRLTERAERAEPPFLSEEVGPDGELSGVAIRDDRLDAFTLQAGASDGAEWPEVHDIAPSYERTHQIGAHRRQLESNGSQLRHKVVDVARRRAVARRPISEDRD